MNNRAPIPAHGGSAMAVLTLQRHRPLDRRRRRRIGTAGLTIGTGLMLAALQSGPAAEAFAGTQRRPGRPAPSAATRRRALAPSIYTPTQSGALDPDTATPPAGFAPFAPGAAGNPFLRNAQAPPAAAAAGLAPVAAAALLLASNTVGASCLALPEVCRGPGLGAGLGLLAGAYVLNGASGLAIARAAIDAAEEEKAALASSRDAGSAEAAPHVASFRELAAHRLGPEAGLAVSVLSMLVNTCALAFDVSRMGPIAWDAAAATGWAGGDHTAVADGGPLPMLLWTGAPAALVATQTNRRLSTVASLNVVALLAAFGSVLVPAVAGLPEGAGWAAVAGPTAAPVGWDDLAQAAPVILMAMVFQNIVPSVVKLLDYDWHRSAAAILLGSAIPLGLYAAWCLVCLAGGDEAGSALLGADGRGAMVLSVFSVVTVMGSTLGSIMSLSEEVQPFLGPQAVASDVDRAPVTPAADGYPALSVLLAVAAPLAANLMLGDGADLTPALALAGGLGSPLLYGAIPAMMLLAPRPQQQLPSDDDRRALLRNVRNSGWGSEAADGRYPWAAHGLPALGLLFMATLGRELASTVAQVTT